MKKTIISVLLALVVAGGLRAQDTLWQRVAPLSNYYTNNWIDTTNNYVYSIASFIRARVIARQFVSPKDSLPIYGIAAMMVTPLFDNYPIDTVSYLQNNWPLDPTLDHCQESLLLYQYHGGTSPTMQQLGDSLPIHALNTPVSHWMMKHPPVPTNRQDTLPKPVYERYFSTPQTVYDTFFAAFTWTNYGYSPDNHQYTELRPYLACLCFGTPNFSTIAGENQAALIQEEWNSSSVWEYHYGDNLCAYYIFPILTPQDTTVPVDTTVAPVDTTIVPGGDTIVPGGDTIVPGGDTLAVRNLGQLSRYVAVMPNPARDRATVTSSFGITRIEAYDSRGRLVHTLDPSHTASQPLSLTLDLSAWPRGTYLLRILTPLGPTTRKLLLR